MTSLQQAYSFSKSQNPDLVSLIKGEMIADLQDAGKLPDKKQRFTIRRIILLIEDKWDMNNFVGKGSNPQVVLFNLWIILSKTSH